MICLEEIADTGLHRLVSIACGHVYGESCIRKWLEKKKTCPTCKARYGTVVQKW